MGWGGKISSLVQTKLSTYFGFEDESKTINNIEPFGDQIRKKSTNITRIAFQNVNGMKLEQAHTGLDELDRMRQLEIDILGMAETNIYWSQEKKLQLATISRLAFDGTSRSIASSTIVNSEGYLPGGTAMISNGAVSGRCHARGADHYGRFTWMAFRGRDNSGLLVITAYRVCQSAGSKSGPTTAYSQQWMKMRQDGIEYPDPRNSIFEAMTDIIDEWGDKGFHPLIMIDANATLNDEKLMDFLELHQLIDIIDDANDGTPPSSYSRGPNRLDYLFGARHVRDSVIRSGAMGTHEGVSLSDHTLQYIDLDTQTLFRSDPQQPISRYEREFSLFNTKKKNRFLNKLNAIYKHQRIAERTEELHQLFKKFGPTPSLIERYQKLDNEIVLAIKAAANATGQKNFGYQRSPELVAAGQKIIMFKAISSCVHRGVAYSTAVYDLAERLQVDLPARDSLTRKSARSLVGTAIREKRDIEKNDDIIRTNWLMELAEERAKEKDTDAEKELKQMVSISKQRIIQSRLTALFKPEWSTLDYIEYPLDQWFLTEDGSELYEFVNGIFIAHGCIEDNVFETYGVMKTLPETAKVVDIEVTESGLYLDDPTNQREQRWRRVIDAEEIEQKLIKRNQTHLQQMYVEESPQPNPNLRQSYLSMEHHQ